MSLLQSLQLSHTCVDFLKTSSKRPFDVEVLNEKSIQRKLNAIHPISKRGAQIQCSGSEDSVQRGSFREITVYNRLEGQDSFPFNP